MPQYDQSTKEIIRPKVGLGVILMKRKNEKVLLGKRKGSHGEGTWSFPGGHLEWMEDFKSCASREILEETGLKSEINYYWANPTENRADFVTNDFFKEEDKHYVTLYLRAYHLKGKPKIMEPNKCEAWQWYKWSELPVDNLFIPIRNLIRQGYNPFNS